VLSRRFEVVIPSLHPNEPARWNVRASCFFLGGAQCALVVLDGRPESLDLGDGQRPVTLDRRSEVVIADVEDVIDVAMEALVEDLLADGHSNEECLVAIEPLASSTAAVPR
jgi:hypothetical protein